MIKIRKIKITVEDVWHDGGPELMKPLRVGSAVAVVANPHAGHYEPHLLPFQAALRSLGTDLSKRLVCALGSATMIEAYGKGAIVGSDGELEHAAVWHEAGGWAMRQVLGEPKAIVPSSKTIGAIGTRLMVPLGHKDAAYVRSHFSATEIGQWDAPRSSEIVFGIVMATGPRVHARVGGLAASQIAVNDGQR